MLHRTHEAIGRTLDGEVSLDAVEASLAGVVDEGVPDDVLRLMFIACHPSQSRESRVALTLRVVGGLSTDEIARAFLAPEPTVAQRIVRAKRTLAEARVPFELPARVELGARLSSVLEVVYLIFNEGYLATSGDDLRRLHLHPSRSDARVDASGELVLLLAQVPAPGP